MAGRVSPYTPLLLPPFCGPCLGPSAQCVPFALVQVVHCISSGEACFPRCPRPSALIRPDTRQAGGKQRGSRHLRPPGHRDSAAPRARHTQPLQAPGFASFLARAACGCFPFRESTLVREIPQRRINIPRVRILGLSMIERLSGKHLMTLQWESRLKSGLLGRVLIGRAQYGGKCPNICGLKEDPGTIRYWLTSQLGLPEESRGVAGLGERLGGSIR